MKIISKIFLVLIIFLTGLIVWVNVQLYTGNNTEAEKRKDILLQLNFLNHEIKNNNLGDRMQSIFPEGFVFTNALYGLSWCEYGISDFSKNNKNQAISEALFAYDQINSEKAQSIFSPHLKPTYGIYYQGWKNYLLSKILLLDSTFVNDDAYKTSFIQQCAIISEALENSSSPYLPSYDNETWPADMCVAMASLSNHDKLFEPKYKAQIDNWIKQVQLNLDPKTGLLPHKVNSVSGASIIGVRGCSISLMLRLMAEIDLQFAKEQYQLFKQQFVSTTFGLPSINEYPKGQKGKGDIDSGPVVFGVGFAGTIVSIGTFSLLGDMESAENQYKTIHAFGFGFKTPSTKKYILGQLPIADAFIVWSRSSALNAPVNIHKPSVNWRIKFQVISLFIISILWLLYFSKNIILKLRKTKS